MERFPDVDAGDPDLPTEGFYPQYLRSDLIAALREWFCQTEELRTQPNAYDAFVRRVMPGSTMITFNYDVALERALAKVGKWDIGKGYGFTFLPDRPSSTTVYKLHGSVNWFKRPVNDVPPPVIVTRDLRLLGYDDLADPRIPGDEMGVDNSGALVLPAPRKTFYWQSFWTPLWNAGAGHLRSANEVFIHGYSMPAADARARQLLFDNIGKSTAIHIHCRRRSDRLAEEFRSRGFTCVRSYSSVDFEAWAVSE